MVSPQLSTLNGNCLQKPFLKQLLLPSESPDALPSDFVELDFSDVFGPITVQASKELSSEKSSNLEGAPDSNKNIFNDPAVIHSRSHSFVGPTSYISQSLKLSKINLHETEDAQKELKEEKSYEQLNDICLEDQSVELEDFEVLKVVGQGAFGKVYQVRRRGTSDIYAMKVMRKDTIMQRNHAEYVISERDILTKVDHPFIVRLGYSFQTKYRLYLVLDFINGGHLFFQLYHQGLFREDLARFYAAEIVSAVSHLHANGVMHRDLKPENILLDAHGHVVLTDFGLAKQFNESTRSNSLCGTLEYMAPEIVFGKGHDKVADWWSVGILLFEMLTGKPPFISGNRQKIQQKIIKDKIRLPAFLSSEAHSLLKGKEASKRLGCGPSGSEMIKNHKWFKSINWKKLEAREVRPSFVPEVAGKHCVANFEDRWTNMPVLDSPVASPKSKDNPFKGFNWLCTTKAPIMAPAFPAAAEIPWHVERNLAGNSSAGTINVVLFGPKLAKKRDCHENGHHKEASKLDFVPSNLINEIHCEPVPRDSSKKGHHKHSFGQLIHFLYGIHSCGLVYKPTSWIYVFLCELKTIKGNIQQEPCAGSPKKMKPMTLAISKAAFLWFPSTNAVYLAVSGIFILQNSLDTNMATAPATSIPTPCIANTAATNPPRVF
ncbi:serine/threonine-protein kinase AtPK2/AtPK19-like [Senna tora]|uniref:non-specific serine/threonine protein kinase n=1 Tax=Senna tora TaxID=362788 RepID=A0A834WGV7_9FABA|nr:serine/threonine-protein kinase AtPK2/AtPK19-like [Senna tora]